MRVFILGAVMFFISVCIVAPTRLQQELFKGWWLFGRFRDMIAIILNRQRFTRLKDGLADVDFALV